jgi:hypothetical protein
MTQSAEMPSNCFTFYFLHFLPLFAFFLKYLCFMNFEFQHLIPADVHPDSRVWIYQSSRLFTLAEALQIEKLLEDFVENWQSHGVPVKGYANLLFGQFIVMMADETATGVSGCSTDTSVHLIKQIEQQFDVSMFDRQTLAFIIKDKVQLLPMAQLNYAATNSFLNADTLYFNNLVATKDELLHSWIIPIKQSWLSKRISFTQTA